LSGEDWLFQMIQIKTITVTPVKPSMAPTAERVHMLVSCKHMNEKAVRKKIIPHMRKANGKLKKMASISTLRERRDGQAKKLDTDRGESLLPYCLTSKRPRTMLPMLIKVDI